MSIFNGTFTHRQLNDANVPICWWNHLILVTKNGFEYKTSHAGVVMFCPCLFCSSDNVWRSQSTDAPPCVHFSIDFTPSWVIGQISVEKCVHRGASARRERQTMLKIVTWTKQTWTKHHNTPVVEGMCGSVFQFAVQGLHLHNLCRHTHFLVGVDKIPRECEEKNWTNLAWVAGLLVHLHPALPDCVFPAAGWNHPPHLPCGPPPRQVCPLHHDTRHLQVKDFSSLSSSKCCLVFFKGTLAWAFWWCLLFQGSIRD